MGMGAGFQHQLCEFEPRHYRQKFLNTVPSSSWLGRPAVARRTGVQLPSEPPDNLYCGQRNGAWEVS